MSKKFKLGVLGNPIEHSLSPFIHSRFARNENINIEYLPFKVNDSDFELFIKEFFLDNASKGLNVTLPHKNKAADLKGIISSEAKYISAVNTIASDKKNLFLYSTDGIGFISDMEKNKSFSFVNKNILLIGAGAAAESILYRIAKEQVFQISIMNRTKGKADRLIRKYSNMALINNDLDKEKPYDLIINCSSAGLTGEFKPIENILINNNTYFYDLNYSLVKTPFCRWALNKSDKVFDGMGMLVFQAAHSFNKWFSVFPETQSVINDLEAMRE
tara:strand:+ start:10150 stop:10968 length:819 start_codon:yes stop_codon:yes gene_type:complete